MTSHVVFRVSLVQLALTVWQSVAFYCLTFDIGIAKINQPHKKFIDIRTKLLNSFGNSPSDFCVYFLAWGPIFKPNRRFWIHFGSDLMFLVRL